MSSPCFVEQNGVNSYSQPYFVSCVGKSSEPRPSKKTRSHAKRSAGDFPQLKPWPELELKAITKVCKAILRHLAMLDEEGLFASPVIEQMPDIDEVYLSMIDTPMDFRTIQEDRIHYYESIRELQDDLILVFRNCATFNDESTEYHAFAM